MFGFRDDIARVKEQNVDFYNEISEEYDRIMEEGSNRQIRNIVAVRFRESVEGGWVLDFGGGTGQDMDWLAAGRYKIIFCEPSSGMRQKAMRRKEEARYCEDILFLDDVQADFTGWTKVLPFPQKVDAVLSNFAVFNCIPDLPLLFTSLSCVTKHGAQLIALILDEEREAMAYRRLRKLMRRAFFGQRADLLIRYKSWGQFVFFHTDRAIRKAASGTFDLLQAEKVTASPFQLIHMVRK